MDRKIPPSPLPTIWATIKKYVGIEYHAINAFINRVLSDIGDIYRGTRFYSWWISLCERYWIVHIIDRGIYWAGLTLLFVLIYYWIGAFIVIAIGALFLMFVRIASAFFLGGRINPPLFHIAEAYGDLWNNVIKDAFGLPFRFIKWLFVH